MKLYEILGILELYILNVKVNLNMQKYTKRRKLAKRIKEIPLLIQIP